MEDSTNDVQPGWDEPTLEPGKFKIQITNILTPMSVNYQNASWYYVISSAAFWLVSPIAMPVMLIASKMLKRSISWFPREETL